MSPAVYRYLVNRGLPEHVVEETLQDTFLAIWRDAATFRGASAYAWIWGIARHKLNDAWRRHAPERQWFTDAAPSDSVPDPAGEPRFAAAQVRAMLAALSPADRDLVHWAFVEELPYRDVAAVLGIPVGTVKSRISRIRRQLQRQEDSQHG